MRKSCRDELPAVGLAIVPGPACTSYPYLYRGFQDENSWSKKKIDFVAHVDFGSLRKPVNPAGIPADPGSGYQYRSFSLGGSNGLPGKGFLRVKITKP